MGRLENVDKNFKVQAEKGEDRAWLDARQAPFKIHGLLYENGAFLRMPQRVADKVSESVVFLNTNTAGGRVRFATNSREISINAEMYNTGKMSHFTLCGSAGFDLYAVKGGVSIYKGTFVPPFDIENGYISTLNAGSDEMTEYTINFPLYSGVKKLFIGLDSRCVLEMCRDYGEKRPIVYYGSSITQGGCASRPGNSYQSIVSRGIDADFINLGFSGSALGEEEIAQYIASLEMSAFVYDYDHNAPDCKHLRLTHERMFKIIRKKHPTLPVIMMTRPQAHLNDEEKERRNIIKTTYDNAKAAGDNDVYFIDGSEAVRAFGGDSCTVDNCHPNDLGFMAMARKLLETAGPLFAHGYGREF